MMLMRLLMMMMMMDIRSIEQHLRRFYTQYRGC